MERLTERTECGIVGNNKKVTNYPLYKVAEYDELDHGITGQCFEKLAEYEDLEEQGLLLRLPCKVGSTLYRVYKKPTKCTAYGEYKDDYACQGCEKECDSSYVWAIYKYKADIKTIVCLSDEIGKTVFLTQAEAEQKLKEMESD